MFPRTECVVWHMGLVVEFSNSACVCDGAKGARPMLVLISAHTRRTRRSDGSVRCSSEWGRWVALSGQTPTVTVTGRMQIRMTVFFLLSRHVANKVLMPRGRAAVTHGDALPPSLCSAIGECATLVRLYSSGQSGQHPVLPMASSSVHRCFYTGTQLCLAGDPERSIEGIDEVV